MLEVWAELKRDGFGLKASFQVEEAGVTALFGPSGSGKTTLVNLVAGLLTPDRGRIRCGERVLFDSERGINLPVRQRRVGYVFQEGRLFPHLTVRSNLLYGHKPAKGEANWADPDKVVELLGLGELLERRPARLSGGEKQRVAVGRALLSNPGLLLMDEPLASLDRDRKEEVLPYLARLPREFDLPILYVSHSRWELERLARRVVVMNRGESVTVLSDREFRENLADCGRVGRTSPGRAAEGWAGSSRGVIDPAENGGRDLFLRGVPEPCPRG